MEIGHYGWNQKLNIFQEQTVFLIRPAPNTSNYGVLNIGDAPFDGSSSGYFNNYGVPSIISINLKSASAYPFLYQVNGINVVTISASGNTNVYNDASASTSSGVLNLGTQFFSGAGQFSGSANGTYLAINSSSGFTGNFIDIEKAGSTQFKVDSSGSVITAGIVWGSQSPGSDGTYGTICVGPSFFIGAGQFAGSTSGTALAISYATGYAGNFADWQVNGISKFKVDSSGKTTARGVDMPDDLLALDWMQVS